MCVIDLVVNFHLRAFLGKNCHNFLQASCNFKKNTALGSILLFYFLIWCADMMASRASDSCSQCLASHESVPEMSVFYLHHINNLNSKRQNVDAVHLEIDHTCLLLCSICWTRLSQRSWQSCSWPLIDWMLDSSPPMYWTSSMPRSLSSSKYFIIMSMSFSIA